MNLGQKVVKHRRIILIVAVILLIPAVIGMRATRINYDMLTYLPDDIETMKGQEMLQKDFGKGGFSLVVVENMKTSDVSKLKSDIEKVKHVDSVVSLEDVLDPTIPQEMLPTEIRNNIHNKDASMLVVFFKTSTSDDRTLEAIDQIRGLAKKDVYVSGLSSLVSDLKTLCQQEEPKYVGIAVLLSLAAMMLLLDSYAAPFIFLLSIGMAILYNMGTNVFFGEISYITKAIAAVLQLGVTMDYSIFLWHSYAEKLEKLGGDEHRLEAMEEAINDTLTAVTGSSITTIAGFLALCFMTYKMGMDLGIVVAKGCALGVIASVTILPCMILASGNILNKTVHRSLIPDCSKLAHGLTSRYGIYIAIFILLVVPAVHGYNNENIVYDFSKMLASNSKQLDLGDDSFMVANDKLEKDFNIGTTHLIIADSSMSPKDGRAMSDEIKKVDGVDNVLGMDSFLGTSIPRQMLPDQITNSLTAKGHQLIMVNSKYKVSTDECNKQVDQLKSITKKYDKGAKVIGEAAATKDLIQITNKDFKVVSLISIAAVFVIILLVLKSASLPFILVAAIEFAIYVNLGIPGYTGLELPFIVPVCISTIQLGSTVDYAILMSTRYKQERMSGKTKRDAIQIATATSIPSVMVSALGFFTATFGVSIYSNIGIISTFCQLMARGAIISMLTVILLLPSLLMALDKVICKTTKGLKEVYAREHGNSGSEAAAQ